MAGKPRGTQYGPGGYVMCTHPGCDLEAYRRGLCTGHYRHDLAKAMPPGRPPNHPRAPDEPTPALEWVDVARLAVTVPGEGWRRTARCAPPAGVGVPFYGGDSGQVNEARRFCRECPALYDCLADALATRDEFGVRGGCSERDRRRLVKVVARWRREQREVS